MKITGRDRRALALGFVVLTLAWLGLRGVPSLLRFAESEVERIEQDSDFLVRAQRRLAEVPALNDSLDVLEAATENLGARLLRGGDPQTAAVDLTGRLTAAAHTVGIVVEHEGRSDGAAVGRFQDVTVSTRFESDFAGIRRVLSSLESDPAVRVQNVRIFAPDDHVADTDVERLRMTVVASGWFIRHASDPEGST